METKWISNKFYIKEDKIMAMEITSNYSSYAAQGMADNTKKRAEKTSEPVKTNNTESTSDYLSKLQKQVPDRKSVV